MSFEVLTVAIPLAIWIIGGIIWITRLGEKVKNLLKAQDLCLLKRQEHEKTTREKLEQVSIILERIETDIKWIVKAEKRKNNEDL